MTMPGVRCPRCEADGRGEFFYLRGKSCGKCNHPEPFVDWAKYRAEQEAKEKQPLQIINPELEAKQKVEREEWEKKRMAEDKAKLDFDHELDVAKQLKLDEKKTVEHLKEKNIDPEYIKRHIDQVEQDKVYDRLFRGW